MKYFRNISWLTFKPFDTVKNRFCKYLTSKEKGKEVRYERRPVIEGIATPFRGPIEQLCDMYERRPVIEGIATSFSFPFPFLKSFV